MSAVYLKIEFKCRSSEPPLAPGVCNSLTAPCGNVGTENQRSSAFTLLDVKEESRANVLLSCACRWTVKTATNGSEEEVSPWAEPNVRRYSFGCYFLPDGLSPRKGSVRTKDGQGFELPVGNRILSFPRLGGLHHRYAVAA